ncbi:MAG: excinuclease ABC subunit C [Flavobacteriaceae bacterium CG_4_8_14_3_um_filter_34_10]|nr:MAG: excinuclease ABC subunit C [Flavobacteriaceae bacterium CG_4_8_14_3_um_filter_34_10]
MKKPCTYIVTNTYNKVLYTGVTSEIENRTVRHKKKHYKKSFSAQYNCNKLVFYRFFPTMLEAIAYEKKLKAGSRAKKIALIVEMNPEWRNLFLDFGQVEG